MKRLLPSASKKNSTGTSSTFDAQAYAFSSVYKQLTTNQANDADLSSCLFQSLDLNDYLENHSGNTYRATVDILSKHALNEYDMENNRLRLKNEEHKEQLRATKKEIAIKKRKSIMPIVSILMTFIFITWIGGKFQEDSFNRGVVFEAQMKRFQAAEDRVTEIGFDLRDVYYRIKWDRSEDPESSRFDSFVREKRNELETLDNNLRGFPEEFRDTINKSLLDTINNIDDHLKGKDLDLSYIEKLRENVSQAFIAFLNHPGNLSAR